MSYATWLLIAIAGIGGVGIAVLAYSSWAACECDKVSVETETARLIAGLSFVAAGLLALAQQRFRGVGILLTAVGWTWFIYEVGYIYEPLPYTAARLTDGIWQPLLAQLAVSFPSGRLRSRVERTVVGSAYALYATTNLVLLFFWHSRGPRLTATNLLFVQDNARIEGAAELVSQAMVILLAAAVLGIVVWHWRTASVPGRRALAPLMWASGPLAVVVAAYALLGTRYYPSLLPLAMTALPIAFAVGLLRINLGRAGISGLVIELDRHPPTDRLQQALSRILHDPTLRVAYWARDDQRFVDASGQTVEIPPDGSDRVATRIDNDGNLIAMLLYDRAVLDDEDLVDASVAAARLALQNERLNAELSAQLQEVRASRARVVNARDGERQRLERDLHDGAQQRLVSLSIALRLVQARVGPATDPQIASTLDDALRELSRALADLRELAHGIHPAILTEAGLGPALASLVERSPVPVATTLAVDGRMRAPVEVAAYYVVSEALTNIAKHARASRATIEVRRVDDALRIRVADDGVGGAAVACGSGLEGLIDRVRALDGQLEIESPAGSGTTILAFIPCGSLPTRNEDTASDP